MIRIDFYLAIALYLLVWLGLILFLWLGAKIGREKTLSLDPKFIWFCPICAYTYINTREESISVCPRCGSYNKR